MRAGVHCIGAAPGILAVAKPAGLLGFGLGASGFRGGFCGFTAWFLSKELLVVVH